MASIHECCKDCNMVNFSISDYPCSMCTIQLNGKGSRFKKIPKTITCTCGKVLVQGSGYFATDYKCSECNSEYNSSGHKLVPRNQWGEETGEHFY